MNESCVDYVCVCVCDLLENFLQWQTEKKGYYLFIIHGHVISNQQ